MSSNTDNASVPVRMVRFTAITVGAYATGRQYDIWANVANVLYVIERPAGNGALVFPDHVIDVVESAEEAARALESGR